MVLIACVLYLVFDLVYLMSTEDAIGGVVAKSVDFSTEGKEEVRRRWEASPMAEKQEYEIEAADHQKVRELEPKDPETAI